VLKTLIIATVLLPKLAMTQQFQQLPQPRQPGQWCPAGWMASGSYCVPGSDKAPLAIPKNGRCPAGWRESIPIAKIADISPIPLRPQRELRER